MLPAATYRHIAREVHDLLMKPIDGIVLRPNEGNLSILEADMQGPDGTPFEDGSFVLRLVFEKEYPSIPPKGFFLTRIFHPNISERGDICVNTLSKDWEKDLGLRHILLVIRCLLIDPNAESALNEEAAKLLLDDYHEYARRAKVMTGIHAVKRNVFPDAANSTSPNGHGFSHAHMVALRPSKLSNQDASDMGTVDSDGDGRKSTGGGVNPLSSSQGTAEVQRSVYATRDKRRALKRL